MSQNTDNNRESGVVYMEPPYPFMEQATVVCERREGKDGKETRQICSPPRKMSVEIQLIHGGACDQPETAPKQTRELEHGSADEKTGKR